MLLASYLPLWRRATFLCLCWLLGLSLVNSAAEPGPEKKFLSRLVWCTDGAKPADQELKDLEPKLGKKVRRIFKWKNYFEVSRRVLSLPEDEGKRIRISKRCELVINEIDEEQMEVQLFGDKKLTGKAIKNFAPILEKGELLIIGGDGTDNYDDAWLLVISAAAKSE